jgi:predicted RNase H-like HicB family nuclease
VRQYIALIHKEADSDFGVSFPDLPGCVTAGSTLDEARDMAVEALALHLEGFEEDGEAIPEPSSLEAIMSDAENRNGVAILVAAPALAAKAVRVNVTIPEHALRAIDRFAELHGFTRSGFMTRAAERMMAEDGRIVKKPIAPKLRRRRKVA